MVNKSNNLANDLTSKKSYDSLSNKNPSQKSEKNHPNISENFSGKTAKEIEALQFHNQGGHPGKVAMHATKPLNTQRELALAYSPGVAVPCLEIAKNPDCAYDYTAKGNYVAVISNWESRSTCWKTSDGR